MKQNIYLLFVLFTITINMYAQENTSLYAQIDAKYKSLYKFKLKKDSSDNYFSCIKILKEKYKEKGVYNKSVSKKDEDIIIVSKQPAEKNYYEFVSYEKPIIVSNVDTLKVFSIEDVSKNVNDIKKIWNNYNYTITFIEKMKCNFILCKMRPVYVE